MRQVRRFWFLALGFCTAIVAYLLTPGQWLNRLVAVALCTVLTTDQVCLPQGMTGRAVAAMPRVEVAQAEAGLVAQQAEDSLMAQRSREFDDVPITPAPSNNVTPPPYPIDPGPNFPVRRPDFDESPNSSIYTTANMGFQTDEYGNKIFRVTDNNGCQRTYKFKSNTIEFMDFAIPDNSNSQICNNNSSFVSTEFRANGNEAFVQYRGQQIFSVQGLNTNKWTFIYLDQRGNRQIEEIFLNAQKNAQKI